MSAPRTSPPRVSLALSALLLTGALLAPREAASQVVVKVNDDTFMKFGLLLQPWADFTEDPAGTGTFQNIFLRRARIMFGGQIMPGLTFFAETDNPNLGKGSGATKTISSGLILQDAFLSWKIADALTLDGGLILVPLCRDCTSSAAAHMAIDYGSFSFLQSGVTQSVVGRDTGFQARGWLAGKRLEYRVGAFQGLRQTGSRNAFRTAGRIQYQVLEPEGMPFFYPTTFFGKKKILVFGGGWDIQSDYKAFAADMLFDYPVGGGGVTFEVDFVHYDGGDTFKTLPQQNTFLVQGGYFHGATKLFPYLRYETQRISGANADVSKAQVGLGYYLKGHNFNIKAAYTRIEDDSRKGKPGQKEKSDQLSIQLQAFVY
jgi:hypothetical protein